MANLLVVAAALPGQLVVMGGDFPHITREWVDATGGFRVTAKLVSATATSVELQKNDSDKTIQVPVGKLDERSREIVKLAAPIFLVESKMREILQGGEGMDKAPIAKACCARAFPHVMI